MWPPWPPRPASSANVTIVTAWNATFSEAYQFDKEEITYWNFADKIFRMDLKGNIEEDTPLLSFTTGAGEIIVDDTVKRILHFLVPEATLQAVLVPGCYVYDLIMTDINGVRVPLMYGDFVLTDGVTGG